MTSVERDRHHYLATDTALLPFSWNVYTAGKAVLRGRNSELPHQDHLISKHCCFVHCAGLVAFAMNVHLMNMDNHSFEWVQLYLFRQIGFEQIFHRNVPLEIMAKTKHLVSFRCSLYGISICLVEF